MLFILYMSNNRTLEKKIVDLEERILKIEKQIKKIIGGNLGNKKELGSFKTKLAENLDNIGTQDLVIICLKLEQKQSKSQLEDTIKKWGKPSSSWFKSNNFKARLKDKGFIMKDGENEKNEEVFSLTQVKGVKTANKLFKKYELI